MKGFREDINGLRAISVLAVVLFHFGFSSFGGGFVGVDVFFVISGFLMTRIILERLEKTQFRVIDFYFDRARRIVPALAAMCLVLIVLGWFLLPLSDYRALAREAATALIFASNVQFYRETNYFDAAAQDKWLLHTWSLSVEWQFYLIYPFMLMALTWLLPRRTLHWALLVLTIAGFCGAMVVASLDISAAFYLFPTRAWEMLAGGFIYVLPLRLPRESTARALEWTGIAVLIGFIALTSRDAPWPSLATAIPILATMLVMLPARPSSRVLGNPVVSWIGKISYSTYLWHWPLVVVLHFAGLLTVLSWQIGGTIASLAAGSISYLFIEKPTSRIGRGRSGQRGAQSQRPWPRELAAHWLLFVILVPALAGSVWIWRHDGVVARLPAVVRMVEAGAEPDLYLRTHCFNEGDPTALCRVGGGKNTPVKMLVFGDSHALAIAPAVRKAMIAEGDDGVMLFRAFPGCATLEQGGVPREPGCRHLNQAIVPLLRARDRFPGIPAVIVNSWRGYILTPGSIDVAENGRLITPDAADYKRRAGALYCAIARVRPLTVMLGYPDWDFNVPLTMARQLMLNRASPDIRQSLAHHLNRHAAEREWLTTIARECHFRLLDPAPYLCMAGSCPGTDHYKPLYYDAYHLNDAGTDRLVPMFRQPGVLSTATSATTAVTANTLRRTGVARYVINSVNAALPGHK